MNEFEQCMLMTLKEIKSHLSDIAANSGNIAKELKLMNEYTGEEVDYSDDIHLDLKSIATSLDRIYQIQDQRL